MTRRVAALAMPIAVIALLASCGSNGSTISNRASSWLQAQVAAARRDAATGDFTRANTELDQIDASIAQFVKENDLSASRARAVSTAVDDVRGALHAYAAASTTKHPTTTTTTPPAPRPDGRGKHDHGPGRGGANDNGD